MDQRRDGDLDSVFDDQRTMAGGPLMVQPMTGSGLARASGLAVLNAARWLALALVRREPGPLLAVGFGAGLLARTALSGAVASRAGQSGGLARRQPPAPAASEAQPEVWVETLTVQAVRILRRG
jgi:hypothetical protein